MLYILYVGSVFSGGGGALLTSIMFCECIMQFVCSGSDGELLRA